MEDKFNFKQVPQDWAICYVPQCPRKDECLRYQMCLRAPQGRVYHKCILPTVLSQGECQHFRPIDKIRVALGFRNIFNEVKAKDITRMRAELADFLGSQPTYYRYRDGRRSLTPLQQQWIRDMFRRYGYTEEIVFDDSKDIYSFD